MKSARAMVVESMSHIKTLSVAEALTLHGDTNAAFVDLRDSAELQIEGKIPGAVHVNRGSLESAIDPTLPSHNPVFSSGKTIIFYCHSGGRSALATDTAQQMGMTNITHIGGGFTAWKEAGGPVEKLSSKN
jgi:rhodanese-related sulfurtransferase